MDKKIIEFSLFRYHLLPLGMDPQMKFFEESKLTEAEIRRRKNEFFEASLAKLNDASDVKHPLKVLDNDETYYLFKLAQWKKTEVVQDFKSKTIAHAPFVYVIINNDPNVQKIAISNNQDAFSEPSVVKNILSKTFKRDLKEYGLNIQIEQLFRTEDFWDIVNEHKSKIEFVDFKYIKPNLARISASLPKAFRDAAEDVNSHESHLSFKAPQNGILTNLKKSNKDINGLVEYASEGGGEVKLKIRGLRKRIKTSEYSVTLEIAEIDLEGTPEQVIKLYKEIVKD
jgi:hypothetical protein